MAHFMGMTNSRISYFLRKMKEECSNDSLVTAKKLIKLDCTLIHALSLKDATIIEYMLDDGYDVNEINAFNSTALHEASTNSDLQNVKLLVSRGANVNALDISSKTPVENLLVKSSIQYSHEEYEIFKCLLDQGAHITVDSMAKLFRGADKIERIRWLLEYNADFVTKTKDGLNLLFVLAGNENFDPVEVLRGQNLDINASVNGLTSLMRAVDVGNVNTVDYLLAQGAKVNGIYDNHTVFMRPFISDSKRPSTKNHLKSIELLLQYGADPQYENCEEIFEIVLRDKKFVLIKPYLAHLALIEKQGGTIREDVHAKINSHVMFRNYFDLCKRQIEKMKRTVVYHSVKLYKLLAANEQRMIKYMQNEELLSRLKVILYNKRGSKSYYFKVLRRRMMLAVRIVHLRKTALDILSQIHDLRNNAVILEKIVDYFNIDDLRNMTLL